MQGEDNTPSRLLHRRLWAGLIFEQPTPSLWKKGQCSCLTVYIISSCSPDYWLLRKSFLSHPAAGALCLGPHEVTQVQCGFHRLVDSTAYLRGLRSLFVSRLWWDATQLLWKRTFYLSVCLSIHDPMTPTIAVRLTGAPHWGSNRVQRDRARLN